MSRLIFIGCAIIGACGLSACKKDNLSSADQAQKVTLSAGGPAVVAANNLFGFNFLQAALAEDVSGSNKLISPLSIYLALSMVYNGSHGSTQTAMAHTLNLSGIDLSNLNAVCKALMAQLPDEDKKVQVSIANSLWSNQNDYQPLSSFIDTVQNNFDATVQSLPFNASALSAINNWVSQRTGGKIPSILDAISPSDLMYLVNAIYFNGTWKTAFEPSQTSSANFYLSGGGVESVPFMHQQLTARIAVDSTQTLLELPYGSGGSFAMYIALPADTGQSIGEFASLMNAGLLSAAINKMDSQQVDIALPKWSYSYAIDDMQPALSALGMGIAFGQAADFSNMYSPSQVTPYISKAVHKAYISVDEQGTTAAAATVIGMSFTSVAGVLPFNANHPFLYTIVEKQTGTILFIGIVNDPSLDGN